MAEARDSRSKASQGEFAVRPCLTTKLASEPAKLQWIEGNPKGWETQNELCEGTDSNTAELCVEDCAPELPYTEAAPSAKSRAYLYPVNRLHRLDNYFSMELDLRGIHLASLTYRKDAGSTKGHRVTPINSGLSLFHPDCSQPQSAHLACGLWSSEGTPLVKQKAGSESRPHPEPTCFSRKERAVFDRTFWL